MTAGTVGRNMAKGDVMADEATVEDLAATVDRIAALVGLDIAPAHRPGVIANFTRIAAIAAPVMAFPLPDDLEIAPVFVP